MEEKKSIQKITENLPKSCALCGTLGEQKFVDFDEDQHLPEAFLSLKIVRLLNASDDLRQCSTCGTYYFCIFDTDNDIFCPTHTGEYKRIPKEEAEKIIQEFDAAKDKERQNFRRDLRKAHKAVLRTLSEEELRIVEYIIQKLNVPASIEEIERDLAMTKDTVEKLLVHLKDVKIIKESISGNWKGYSLLTIRF